MGLAPCCAPPLFSMDLEVLWPLWPLACAVPRARSRGCRTLGVLSLCCDTVWGGLVLGAGGPWYPQEVLASVLGQAGWEGPQNLVKEQEKGLSQVIFGMKQFVLSSSP